MSRYIDADAFKKEVEDFPNCYNGWSDTYDKAFIIGAIEEQPSIDIVRCKECRYYIDFIGEQFINAPTLCGRLSTLDNYVVVKADDFCSYGERKESE